MLFYETYFEESNINRKPLIWSHDKIVMKFGPKKWVTLVLGQVYENCPKSKEKCYFTKLTSKRVISTRNNLFGPKCYFTKLTSKRVISTRNHLFGPNIR